MTTQVKDNAKQDLTYGMKKAGLIPNSKENGDRKVVKAKLLLAHVIDLLHDDMTDFPDDERDRLIKIAIDELQSPLKLVTRALTYDRKQVQ